METYPNSCTVRYSAHMLKSLRLAYQALKAPMVFVQRFAAISLRQVKSKL